MSDYKRTDVHSILFVLYSNLTKILLLHYYRTPPPTINHDDYYENKIFINKFSYDEIDDSNEETAGEESFGCEIKNSNVFVSKSTCTPEYNGDLHAIRTEKEGNLIPQGTTLHDDFVVLSKSPLPPLVLYIPQTSPQRRDLGRINDLEESSEKG